MGGMDVKITIKIMLFALCLNLASGLAMELVSPIWASQYGSEGTLVILGKYQNNTEWQGQYNYTQYVQNVTESGYPPIDYGFSIFDWFQAVHATKTVYAWFSYPAIGFPILLSGMGVPDYIIAPLLIIISFFICIFLLELFTGRVILGSD